jgi:hypothetical protein
VSRGVSNLLPGVNNLTRGISNPVVHFCQEVECFCGSEIGFATETPRHREAVARKGQVSGVRWKARGAGCQRAGFKFQVSSFKCQVLNTSGVLDCAGRAKRRQRFGTAGGCNERRRRTSFAAAVQNDTDFPGNHPPSTINFFPSVPPRLCGKKYYLPPLRCNP